MPLGVIDRAVVRLRAMNRKKDAVLTMLSMLASAKTLYVCPMHPEVVSDAPGLCPKCNMKLDPKPQANEAADWA